MEADATARVGQSDLGVRLDERIGTLKDGVSLLFFRFILDDKFDAFVTGEITDDLGNHPRNRLKFTGPVGTVVRPRKPGSSVGNPFGGHAML